MKRYRDQTQSENSGEFGVFQSNSNVTFQNLPIEKKLAMTNMNIQYGFSIIQDFRHELGGYNAEQLYWLKERSISQANPPNCKHYSGEYWYELALIHPRLKQAVLEVDKQNNYLSPELKNKLLEQNFSNLVNHFTC